MPDPLVVQLDVPLPASVAVGRGTAVFVCGWCFCPTARIRSLAFVLNGAEQAVSAHGMPRLDPFRERHPVGQPGGDDEDPLMHSYRSGFWGMLRIGPDAVGDRDLRLRAVLADGGVVETSLGRLLLERALVAPVEVEDGPQIAICMATYNPPSELLAAQLESIRAQTVDSWVCVISDDCSRPEAYRQLAAAVADDPRFILSRSPRRLGFYRNFERALSMVPQSARFVALSDQDDRWHPDKLARLMSALDSAQLVYSDARVVSRDGLVISDTYWSTRRNNHEDLLSLLVANAVTGAASLFRRELLEYALPFPPAQFAHYHDHWLALTALARGDINFVADPLYDYVQHGSASLGHATANRMPAFADRLRSLRTRSARDRMRKWRMHYFVDVARLVQVATILLQRCGEEMSPGKARILHRFLSAEQSGLMLGELAWRGARELVGPPETLGAEWMLFGALLWRRMLGLSARERPQRRLRLDAVPPPDLAPGPERVALAGGATQVIANKIAPLAFAVGADAPRRVNILIPTIDLDHFFGGYIGKLNLARRLAEHGERVRVVTVDPTGPLPRGWRRRLESYSGLAGLTDHVEIAFGRETPGLEVSPQDGFIATTWWTAHVARRAVQELGGPGFVYLIQEYEPFTFPMGSYAALARESYAFAHFAVFSSELLRGYFRAHGLGVYGGGRQAGDRNSVAFQNAITAVDPPPVSELAARASRRLLFYARPEPHAARNLFELGVLALSQALQEGCFRDGWELHGIGTVGSRRSLALGEGASLQLLPRRDQGAYADVLRGHDLGLALMYTPHPSLVPIEMAAAGMLAVTNTFENKTAEAMAAISPNLIAAEPTVDGVAAALVQAAAGVDDYERRVRGSQVNWSRDWARSFDAHLLERIVAALTQR